MVVGAVVVVVGAAVVETHKHWTQSYVMPGLQYTTPPVEHPQLVTPHKQGFTVVVGGAVVGGGSVAPQRNDSDSHSSSGGGSPAGFGQGQFNMQGLSTNSQVSPAVAL